MFLFFRFASNLSIAATTRTTVVTPQMKFQLNVSTKDTSGEISGWDTKLEMLRSRVCIALGDELLNPSSMIIMRLHPLQIALLVPDAIIRTSSAIYVTERTIIKFHLICFIFINVTTLEDDLLIFYKGEISSKILTLVGCSFIDDVLVANLQFKSSIL